MIPGPTDLTRRATFGGDGLSRRRFIQGVGASLSALSVSRALPAFATVGQAPVLAPARVATLGALVETLGRLPHSIVDASRAAAFSREVEDGYPAMAETARSGLDAWLPLLEDGHKPGWFAYQTSDARLATLRALLSSRQMDPPKALWVRQGIQGVAAHFDPDLRGGDVPLNI